MQNRKHSSCVSIFSAKKTQFSHWIVWCEIRFEQTSCRRREKKQQIHETKHWIPSGHVLANEFLYGIASDITKGAHFQFHTHIHLMDYQFPFTHSFMCSQTMNLMSRFNDGEEKKKHETEISRMKRRHFSFHLSFSLVTLEVSFSLCTKYGNTTESSSARRSISVKHSSRFFFFLSFTRVCTLNRHI